MPKLLKAFLTILVGLFVQVTYVETGVLFNLPTQLNVILILGLGIVALLHWSALCDIADKSLIKNGVTPEPFSVTLALLMSYALGYLAMAFVGWMLQLAFPISNVWVFALVLLVVDATLYVIAKAFK